MKQTQSNSADVINILLVDDNESENLIFGEALRELPSKTTLNFLTEPNELMNYFENPNKKKPDIIFLDISMPKKTGIECLQEIKAIKKLKQIPVVMFSTSLNQVDVENSFAFGAHLYVEKPKGYNNLIKLLNHLVSVDWKYLKVVMKKENFVLKY